MNIETKYNIGDHHWCVDVDRARVLRIQEIRVSVAYRGDAPPATKIEYVLEGSKVISESAIVETK